MCVSNSRWVCMRLQLIVLHSSTHFASRPGRFWPLVIQPFWGCGLIVPWWISTSDTTAVVSGRFWQLSRWPAKFLPVHWSSSSQWRRTSMDYSTTIVSFFLMNMFILLYPSVLFAKIFFLKLTKSKSPASTQWCNIYIVAMTCRFWWTCPKPRVGVHFFDMLFSVNSFISWIQQIYVFVHNSISVCQLVFLV